MRKVVFIRKKEKSTFRNGIQKTRTGILYTVIQNNGNIDFSLRIMFSLVAEEDKQPQTVGCSKRKGLAP